MKMNFILAALITLIALPASASESLSTQVLLARVQTLRLDLNGRDLVNWKVGDTANYQISAGMLGKLGTMVEMASSEESQAVWLTETMMLQNQKDVSEMLINRADAKILKYKHNGQDAQIPSDKPEIVSQDYTEITVPAGTFKCIHIVANTTQAKGIQIWANPQATVLEGNLKMQVPTQFGLPMTIELTSFKHAAE